MSVLAEILAALHDGRFDAAATLRNEVDPDAPLSADDVERWEAITRWLQSNDSNGCYTAELFALEYDGDALEWSDTWDALGDVLEGLGALSRETVCCQCGEAFETSAPIAYHEGRPNGDACDACGVQS